MKNWYENGVKKLHPVLKKRFTSNSAIKKYYAKTGGLNVKGEPIIFFWGDKSKTDLDFVKKQLDISKAVSSTGAYIVRNMLTQYLHDAIWVQKTHNMIQILDDLNVYVKNEVAQDNDVILYGYSAGTFITYEYLFNKLRYINLQNLFETLKMDDDFMDFVKSNPKQDTCISALNYTNSGIGTISETGHLILNHNKEQLKQNYLTIDIHTENACAPDKKVRGIVNFASPLVLFYSDFADPEYELNYYNKLMTKYIYENGIFWITANFKEDPLGFPTSRNLTVKEIEERIGLEIYNPSGVIFDNSGIWSKRFFAIAHTSYWNAAGTLSKAIVKSFVNGYKFQYDTKYQAKVIKKKSKKFEL